jgi:hypothetical protein
MSEKHEWFAETIKLAFQLNPNVQARQYRFERLDVKRNEHWNITPKKDAG